MGHGYIARNYGDSCFYGDSQRKQYWRATKSRDIMVFNNYYGNSCGYSCGPKISGFWGGFGAGIGAAFGQWFMGGLNMMGGMFNSMNPFGMSQFMNPFGMSSFGGNWWNSGKSSNCDCSCNCTSESRKSKKTKKDDDDKNNITKVLNDIDNPKFTKITTQILDAITDGIFDQNEYDDIKKALNDALKNTDNNHKTEDEETYNNLIKIIDKLQNTMKPPVTAVTPTTTNEDSTTKTEYEGHQNWNGTDDLTKVTLKRAQDTSPNGPGDVVCKNGENAEITKDANGKYIIKITDRDNGITVTYTQKEEKDGEYIFTSNHPKKKANDPVQEYALQFKDGEYILRQYSWHTGYGDPDVTVH